MIFDQNAVLQTFHIFYNWSAPTDTCFYSNSIWVSSELVHDLLQWNVCEWVERGWKYEDKPTHNTNKWLLLWLGITNDVLLKAPYVLYVFFSNVS